MRCSRLATVARADAFDESGLLEAGCDPRLDSGFEAGVEAGSPSIRFEESGRELFADDHGGADADGPRLSSSRDGEVSPMTWTGCGCARFEASKLGDDTSVVSGKGGS
jgi:hypothetical protein